MPSPQELATQYGFRPQRQAGQNFLTDKKALEKIVAAANLQPTDTVLEIGPGFGALTQELLKRVGKVVAVELDKRLAQALKERFTTVCHPGGPKADRIHVDSIASLQNDKLVVIQADALKLLPELVEGFPSYKVVANIPYNITSAVIRKFLEAKNPPELIVLLVQKEVAERVCAKPGDMSMLSVSVQYYAKPEIVATVKAGCFWPPPRVDSAILKITPRLADWGPVAWSPAATATGAPLQRHPSQKDTEKFFTVVHAGFSAKRKQLQGNLAKSFKVSHEVTQGWLKSAGLSEKIRAEELSVGEWKKLVGVISSIK